MNAEAQQPLGSPPPVAATILERDRRLSQSLLFPAQRRYFEQMGTAAWSTSTVPHYVTNNPAIAAAFADVVVGYLRDLRGAVPRGEPLYILELGAGSGRFGFLFLKALRELIGHASPGLPAVRYVMSDFAAKNLEFLGQHPALRPFVAEGLLDFARFDLERDDTLTLCESGRTLRPGELKAPLIVIANYVFDSVPQDAFALHDGALHDCLVTISADGPEVDLEAPELFSRLQLTYDHRPARADCYPEAELNAVLRACALRSEQPTFLFPCAALRGLSRLAALPGGRLLLLSGDRSEIHERAHGEYGDPTLSVHGSFSMPVNYLALREWFHQRGGLALESSHRQAGLQIAAFVLGASAGPHENTRLAYYHAFERGGCDDFFRLRQGLQNHYDALEFEHLRALIRLSGHDPRILGDCLPSLHVQVDRLSPLERRELTALVERVFDNYFHIGESFDLPFELALLLYGLGDQAAALRFFETSLALYGDNAQTFWNMSLCHLALGRTEAALDCLRCAQLLDPQIHARVRLLRKA